MAVLRTLIPAALPSFHFKQLSNQGVLSSIKDRNLPASCTKSTKLLFHHSAHSNPLPKRHTGIIPASPSSLPTTTTTTQQEPPTPMSISLRHIPSKTLHVSSPTWWLESRFHFSFAEFFNPSNTNFGVLRVLNDDIVQPKSGFGRHPHRNMEIVTYIVDGHLTHKDSMGSEETLGRGCVQYMSAGTGVSHSEMNNSSDLLRFLQIWILPNAQGLKPNYGSRSFSEGSRQNKFQHVVSSYSNMESDSDSGTGIIPIHQDVNMYVAELKAGVSRNLPLGRGRQAYAVCIEGGVSVSNGEKCQTLEARDAIEIANLGREASELQFSASGSSGAHVFVIEMSAKEP